MVELVNRLLGGSEVPLRAFYCRARGGGGRLRQATERGKKEKNQEKEYIYMVYCWVFICR